MKTSTVVTTIQNPTESLLNLSNLLGIFGEELYIVGDKKTPTNFTIDHGTYFAPEDQLGLKWKTPHILPWNSYSRKLIGYLAAANNGSDYIRETDDDNTPLPSFLDPITKINNARLPINQNRWINPYSYFTNSDIWPRGFPLENVADKPSAYTLQSVDSKRIGILQGLANGSPDVDAIYRLTRSNVDDFAFEENHPLLIPQASYAPFNSQATLWNVKLLPLMYLPNTCTFRMTDIWRSFIALRIIKEMDFTILFTKASMFQDRNVHNLLNDFESEIAGYTGNSRFVEELEAIQFNKQDKDLYSMLRIIYVKMLEKGFFSSFEIETLDAWLDDCQSIQLAKESS